MANRIKKIENMDKVFLFIDFSNLYGEEFNLEILSLQKFIINENVDNIHVLLNISNSCINKKIIKEIQTNAKVINHKIRKAAIVGNTKIHDIFIKFISNFIHIQLETFNNESLGKNWLME